MKTKLLTIISLLTVTGGMQAQPYVTASTGTAHVDAKYFESQNRRRDSVAVGYGLTDVIAVEASYFRIQEARYPLPPDPNQTLIPSAVAVRQKLTGFAFGPVIRWNLSEWVTVFTRQTLAFTKTDLFTEQFNFSSGRGFRNGCYQPSVGVNFRPAKGVLPSVGLEMIYVSMSQTNITSTVLNVSFGF